MKSPPRTQAFSLVCFLIAAVACGESGTPEAQSTVTAVTVFVPGDPDGVSMEYDALCELEGTKRVGVEGVLERDGGFQLEGEGPTGIFRGPIELAPGSCRIQFRLRDSNAEVIFTLYESFEIRPPAPPELHFAMIDSPCPDIPFPDAAVLPKTICGPVGGVILSAETAATATAIESVHYAFTPTSDAVFSPIAYEGNLEPAGTSAANLGEGAIETNLWESIVGVVLADAPYSLAITARDAEGATVCTAETSLDVLPSGIAQAHVVLPCPVP